MITGFSYNTKTGVWYGNYENNNKCSFKIIYKNKLGYFIKVGKKEIYLNDEQVKELQKQRRLVKIDSTSSSPPSYK